MRARRAGAASTTPAAASASSVVLANATQEFRSGRSLFDSGDYAAASVAFARVVAMVEHEKSLGPDLQQVASEFAAISRERAAKQATLVYSELNTDVVPPVITSGRLPARPSPDTPAARLDVLELTIDAGGAVEKARLETSRNHYDNRWWVSAAKTWRFQPATRNGRPVRYILRLPITDGGPR